MSLKKCLRVCSGSQPSSANNLARDVYFLAPVQILAASYCRPSIRSASSWVQLSKSTHPYSRMGRTIDRYSFSRVFLESLNFSLFKRERRLPALVTMRFMCWCHLKSCERVIPKWVWTVASGIAEAPRYKGGWVTLFRLHEKSTESDFVALKVIRQARPQLDK